MRIATPTRAARVVIHLSLADSCSTTASPSGRIVPQPSGELDVITRAGGLRDQDQDTWVVLERHGRRAAVPFGSLTCEPDNNISAWPNDTIYLYKEPQTFLAFGASGLQGQFPFSTGPGSSAWRMTLAEAVAAAGGLLDLVADSGSVFLYRREPRELAEALGVDCSRMTMFDYRDRSTAWWEPTFATTTETAWGGASSAGSNKHWITPCACMHDRPSARSARYHRD
jgi:SLBB domain